MGTTPRSSIVRIDPRLRMLAVVVMAACNCRPTPPPTPPTPPLRGSPPIATPTNDTAGPREPSPAPRVTSIAVAESHACALDDAGAVHCWGSNSAGARGLGHGHAAGVAPTVVPGLAPVRRVVADRLRTCVVLDDRTVSCWGEGLVFEHEGSMRIGSSTTPRALPGIRDVAEVALGPVDACARLRDGSARCWGRDFSRLRVAAHAGPHDAIYTAALPADTTSLVLGGGHACALDGAGALWCWGPNTDGQLGVGDTRERTKPTRVPGLPRVHAVAAVNGSTCAITTEGALWCWGGTRCPPMGDCSMADFAVTRPRAIPVPQKLTAIALGNHGGLLLDTEGSAWWFDPLLALAGGIAPRPVVGVDALAEVGIGGQSCARTQAHGVLCWTSSDREVTAQPVRLSTWVTRGA